MTKIRSRLLAAAPFTLPAVACAHTLAGGVPHGHGAVVWGGLASTTALCWALLRGARWLASRRVGASSRLGGARAGRR